MGGGRTDAMSLHSDDDESDQESVLALVRLSDALVQDGRAVDDDVRRDAWRARWRALPLDARVVDMRHATDGLRPAWLRALALAELAVLVPGDPLVAGLGMERSADSDGDGRPNGGGSTGNSGTGNGRPGARPIAAVVPPGRTRSVPIGTKTSSVSAPGGGVWAPGSQQSVGVGVTIRWIAVSVGASVLVCAALVVILWWLRRRRKHDTGVS